MFPAKSGTTDAYHVDGPMVRFQQPQRNRVYEGLWRIHELSKQQLGPRFCICGKSTKDLEWFSMKQDLHEFKYYIPEVSMGEPSFWLRKE